MIFALSVVIAMQAQKEYRSTVGILIERPQQPVLDKTYQSFVGPLDSNAIDTEVQIIGFARPGAEGGREAEPRGRPRVQRHGRPARRASSTSSPIRWRRCARPTSGRLPPAAAVAHHGRRRPSPSSAVVGTLMGHTLIRRLGLTYVINVSVSSVDPVKAAKIANAYGDAYVGERLERQVRRLAHGQQLAGASD